NVALEPLDLSAYFEDPEGDALSFEIDGLPPGLTAGSDGLVTGTPELERSVGAWEVDVRVSDDGSPAATLRTSFELNVIAAGHADLALMLSAAPSPALVGTEIIWRFS